MGNMRQQITLGDGPIDRRSVSPRRRRIIHPALVALHELLEFDGTCIPLKLLRKHVSPKWAMRALEDWDQFCCVSLFTIKWKKDAAAELE
jgi:hypothetical protein